jgi:hypothetical protein
MTIIFLLILVLISASSRWFLKNSQKIYSTETVSEIESFTNLDRKYTSRVCFGMITIGAVLWLFNIEPNKLYFILFLLGYLLATVAIMYVLTEIKFKNNVPIRYRNTYILVNSLRIIILAIILNTTMHIL